MDEQNSGVRNLSLPSKLLRLERFFQDADVAQLVEHQLPNRESLVDKSPKIVAKYKNNNNLDRAALLVIHDKTGLFLDVMFQKCSTLSKLTFVNYRGVAA